MLGDHYAQDHYFCSAIWGLVWADSGWGCQDYTEDHPLHGRQWVPAIIWDLWDLYRRTHSLHATQCISPQSVLSHENLHLLANRVKREKGTVFVIGLGGPIAFLLLSVSQEQSHDHHVPGDRTAAYISQRVDDWVLSEESLVTVDARHSALLHVEFSIGDRQGECPSSVASKSGHEPTAKPAAAFQ